jgi:hypothetical protein
MDINYNILISVAVGVATFLWTVYQYIDSKKREQDLKEFENFHRLIKELVQPENDSLYVDRQTAILFELRHFKRYYPFSYRTLLGLKEKWIKVPNQFPRLLEELDMTIEFLNKKINEKKINAT